jgi:phospholipase/carboxylesterase
MPAFNEAHQYEVRWSGLEKDAASQALVLVHGRGSDADGILSLAAYLPVEGFTLAAPQATNYTWYPHSFMVPPVDNEPWLSSALHLLGRLTEELTLAGIDHSKIYFLGFSQGACLMLEFAARNARRYGGLIAFSGGLIGDRLHRENYGGDFLQTPVFIGSSDPDAHVPAQRVRESTKQLTSMNAVVTERIYDHMGHRIIPEEIKEAVRILSGG